jgi:2-dehydropantoate 2-reductase
MNIIIVGQGAMGLFWYYHIEQLINNHCDYKSTQLHLLASNTDYSNEKISNKITTHPSVLLQAQYYFTDHSNLVHEGTVKYANDEHVQSADLILVCVKSFQISLVLKNISNQLKKDVNIILAHNGMGTLSELPETVIQKHNIYALLTTHGSFRAAPLNVKHTGIGLTDLGLISGVINLAQQDSITRLLNTALPNVIFHQDIKPKQWLKLAINCVINPLTAINDINNGKINNTEYLSTIKMLLKEIVIVADIEGVKLDLNTLEETVIKVAKATAKNSSSMRCDILANRRSEIDYINGYIHRLGIQHNIATPENNKMWQAVKSLVRD